MPGQERLSQKLVNATFADTVFFTNSGAEAIECAIKMARRYHFANGHPERFRIITFEGAFHGRTLAAIAAGGQAKYLEGFGPKVEGFDQVPFGDLKALEAALTPATAAMLIEPIQGEGGLRSADAGIPARACASCAMNAACCLIFDEIQTGVGRTGKLFAHEWSGITPDIMAIAKGIGGGFPIGACLATARAAKGMTAGTPWHDLRRQSARHGGGQCGARHRAGAGVPGACSGDWQIICVSSLARLIGEHPHVFEDIRGVRA